LHDVLVNLFFFFLATFFLMPVYLFFVDPWKGIPFSATEVERLSQPADLSLPLFSEFVA